MAYREEPPRPDAVRIEYGPFPRPWRRALAPLAFLGLVPVAAIFVGDADSLECDRSECVVESTVLGVPAGEWRFRPEDVQTARLDAPPGFAGGQRLEITLRTGERRRVLDTEGSAAGEGRDQLLALRDGNAASVDVDTWPSVYAFFLVGIALTIAGLALRGLFERPVSIEITIDRTAKTMRVVERGLLNGPERILPLEDVRDVVVVHEESALRMGSGGPLPAGRVLLVSAKGTNTLVSRRELWGTDVHDRAAAALRQALGLGAR